MPTRDKEEGFNPEKMFSFWWVDSSEKSKLEKKHFCDYINKFSENKFEVNSVEKIFNLLVHDELHYEKKISTASKKNFLLKCLILSYEKSPDFIKHIWRKYV